MKFYRIIAYVWKVLVRKRFGEREKEKKKEKSKKRKEEKEKECVYTKKRKINIRRRDEGKFLLLRR